MGVVREAERASRPSTGSYFARADRGDFIPEAGLLYRKWPGQSTAEAAHTDPTERDARMRIIEARARALLDLIAPALGLP